MSETSQPPRLPYWLLWTDEHGVSRQKRCEITEFDFTSISAPADPQWLGRKVAGQTTVMVTVLPPGWTGTWHENPKPQWIIPLSGRWFVESMDGQRVEMGAGEMSFGADQHTSPVNGKKGHLSGTVGTEPAVLMLVQFEAPPPDFSTCPLR